MRPSSQFQDVRPSIHFFLESFLVTYLEKKIHELSSKNRTIIFTFLLISRPTFSLFIFYPRPNISNNTRPTIVYNIYIFVSHLFLSPLEFFIFRRIPVSKELRLIAYTRQLGGLENFHERMVRARTIGGVLSRSPVVSQSVTWWQPCKQP